MLACNAIALPPQCGRKACRLGWNPRSPACNSLQINNLCKLALPSWQHLRRGVGVTLLLSRVPVRRSSSRLDAACRRTRRTASSSPHRSGMVSTACPRSAAGLWSTSSKRGVGAGQVCSLLAAIALAVIMARVLTVTSTAGKRARIRSASSGCLSVYSLSDGRSPRRYRSRNASTRWSIGSNAQDALLTAAVLPVHRVRVPGPV